MDTVLLFNENTTRPIASVSMKDIPSTTLNHIISSNQYLALPRLSSQVNMNGFVIYIALINKNTHFCIFRAYWIRYAHVNGTNLGRNFASF